MQLQVDLQPFCKPLPIEDTGVGQSSLVIWFLTFPNDY